MDMIIHQAKSMDSMAITLNTLLKKKQKTCPVSRGKENIVPSIASHHYMIIATG